jgi:hypothetical protein
MNRLLIWLNDEQKFDELFVSLGGEGDFTFLITETATDPTEISKQPLLSILEKSLPTKEDKKQVTLQSFLTLFGVKIQENLSHVKTLSELLKSDIIFKPI